MPRARRCVIFSRAVAKMPKRRRVILIAHAGHEYMREIVLDTETTGLDPVPGPSAGRDRLHRAAQPHSDRRRPSTAISTPSAMCRRRLSRSMACPTIPQGQAAFAEIADDFLAFIGDAPLVIHNAGFDHGFLNAELERAERRADRARAAGRHAAAGAPQASRPGRTGSTICARATASTIRAAPSTARCSTPRSWPRSISS